MPKIPADRILRLEDLTEAPGVPVVGPPHPRTISTSTRYDRKLLVGTSGRMKRTACSSQAKKPDRQKVQEAKPDGSFSGFFDRGLQKLSGRSAAAFPASGKEDGSFGPCHGSGREKNVMPILGWRNSAGSKVPHELHTINTFCKVLLSDDVQRLQHILVSGNQHQWTMPHSIPSLKRGAGAAPDKHQMPFSFWKCSGSKADYLLVSTTAARASKEKWENRRRKI